MDIKYLTNFFHIALALLPVAILQDIPVASPLTDFMQQHKDLKSISSRVDTIGHSFLALLRTSSPNQTQLVDVYKPHLTDSDYVSTISASEDPGENLNYTMLLPGTKGVIYYSLAEIEKNAPTLKEKGIHFVGYDLEAEYSPADDLLDPTDSIRRASETAHINGLKFLAVPGYPFSTPEAAEKFAPYADIYVIQAQARQSDPYEYRSLVTSISDQIRSNSDALVVTELSTEGTKGTASNMMESFSSVSGHIDGVTIWSGNSNDALTKVKSFLEWFESRYR
jgi:hypothetical protein